MRSWALLAISAVLLAVLAAIAVAVFRKGRSEEGERPKHRMLEDD